MKLSARNVFPATVSRITLGGVNAEVELKLNGGDPVVASITKASAERLGLREGVPAHVIVKATSVILGRELHSARISARNVLCGTVTGLKEGQVSTEVSLSTGANTLTAIITNESAKRLELAMGVHICAAFKASSVILGVE